MIYLLLIMLFLIFISAIIVSSEVAIVVISENKVNADAVKGNKRAKKIQRFRESPKQYLLSLQVMTTLIALTNGAIFSISYAIFSDTMFPQLEEYIKIVITLFIAFTILTLYLVIGTILPKRLGNKHTEYIAYSTIGIVVIIKKIMSPLMWVINCVSRFSGHLFGLKANDGERAVTEEEILRIIEQSSKTGSIDEEEREMIQNIFDFDDTIVEEIMTHRTEIAALSLKSTKKQVVNYVKNGQFTRLPVYDGNIDHIIGTIHVKDLLKYVDTPEEKFYLSDLLREPYFIPDSKNTSELFKEMQKEKKHIAIVLDEYGGTAGLVTIEDLIEEILGNIFDEYDEVEEEITLIEENVYEIDGLASIHDAEDIIKSGLPIDEYDTLSGFILGQLGRLPNEKERVVIDFNDYRYEVLDIKDKVISKVKVTKITRPNNTLKEKQG